MPTKLGSRLSATRNTAKSVGMSTNSRNSNTMSRPSELAFRLSQQRFSINMKRRLRPSALYRNPQRVKELVEVNFAGYSQTEAEIQAADFSRKTSKAKQAVDLVNYNRSARQATKSISRLESLMPGLKSHPVLMTISKDQAGLLTKERKKRFEGKLGNFVITRESYDDAGELSRPVEKKLVRPVPGRKTENIKLLASMHKAEFNRIKLSVLGVRGIRKCAEKARANT